MRRCSYIISKPHHKEDVERRNWFYRELAGYVKGLRDAGAIKEEHTGELPGKNDDFYLGFTLLDEFRFDQIDRTL